MNQFTARQFEVFSWIFAIYGTFVFFSLIYEQDLSMLFEIGLAYGFAIFFRKLAKNQRNHDQP